MSKVFLPSLKNRWVTLVVLACLAMDSADAQPSTQTVFDLPFSAKETRGFCALGNRLVLFHHPTRTLLAANSQSGVAPVENLKGWAVSDAAILGGKPIYCSRDRTLRIVNAKVTPTPIPGTSNLVSIAVLGTQVFLLDAGKTSAIVCLDARNGQQLSRTNYDGIHPVDIAVNSSGVFVLDLGDHCIHKIDRKSGKTSLRIQVGPGVKSGSGGIAFLGPDLYVHEADFHRLRPVTWQVHEKSVSSWKMPLKMTFVQESDNQSTSDVSTVDFHVPIPTDGYAQVVEDLKWSAQPDKKIQDKFGQKIGVFRDIAIPPNGHHDLRYETTVYTNAVQYDPPKIPLASLDEIPEKIRSEYLAPDPVYRLDSKELISAARDARLDANGAEPADVRTLIENIAWYQSKRFNYVMDDAWDDSLEVFNRGTGSCSEYSFVFSSLCRLNNIPTRLVGGITMADYTTKHETNNFHRWTEVYFPSLGWIPVDVTKFDDGKKGTRDFEFMFGNPGHTVCLSRGGVDDSALGTSYYIRRRYRGGKRVRKTFVIFEPHDSYDVKTVTITAPKLAR